jgi:hypothetical protein
MCGPSLFTYIRPGMTWYAVTNAQAYSTSALITAVEKFYGAGSMSNNQLGGKERKKREKNVRSPTFHCQSRKGQKNENNHFLCKKTILYCHTTF